MIFWEFKFKEIWAHLSVQIRYKVLLLSAGNIQAEIFNRLSRSIRQELTKNAVQKESKTSISVFFIDARYKNPQIFVHLIKSHKLMTD